MAHSPSKPSRSDSRPKNEESIARCILNYLRQHPQAGNSLEGTTRWRLVRQRVSESTEVVQGVLERLIDQVLIRERRLAISHSVSFK